MWSTPAPPSTARVAASIWSGVGEVNTLPAHAASSIPSPTNPPCSGSWPEPPPETRPTLPCFGPPARSTTRLSASICTRSGWAAPRPARLSGTTSSTRLMSFLTRATVGVVIATCPFSTSRVGVCGFGYCDAGYFCGAMVADVLVQECSHEPSDDRADQVNEELTQVVCEFRIANDAFHQQRTNLARRIERCARDRANQNDDSVNDEADDNSRKARRRTSINGRAKHGKDEDSCADCLGGDSHQHTAGVGVVPNRSEAKGSGVIAREDNQCEQRAHYRANKLRAYVRRRCRPIHLLCCCERDGHRRIDVTPADVADGVHRGENRKCKRKRDRAELCTTERVVPGQEHSQRHRAGADEDQDGSANDLGGQLLGESRRRRHDGVPLMSSFAAK